MRTAWFTTEDLDWIKGQDGAEVPNGDRPSILVLDRVSRPSRIFPYLANEHPYCPYLLP